MKSLGTILSLFVLAILATARFAGADAIMAAMPPHYGERVVNTLGVLAAIAVAIVLDRLIRALYWDGYLRRKLKRETPAVIESLLTIALVLLGVSIGLYFEAGVSFTGLITASGATAIILGIALQAAINDVFSGLSVNLDGSFEIGDWLTVYSDHFPEPVYGRVQGVTWRITILRLSDGRRLIVPNHCLTANPVMNHSRPHGAKRLSVEVPVAGNFPAERVIAILLAEAFRAVRYKAAQQRARTRGSYRPLRFGCGLFSCALLRQPGRGRSAECKVDHGVGAAARAAAPQSAEPGDSGRTGSAAGRCR
jgi:small-conductance mechanosensitive channel